MSSSAPFLEELSSRSTRESFKPAKADSKRPREYYHPSTGIGVTKPFILNFASQAPDPDDRRTPRTTVTRADREPTDVY